MGEVVVHVRERETGHVAYELDGREEGIELVDERVRKLKDSGVSARGELLSAVFGRAARVILEVASNTGAGLVVMGSRGLSDLAGLVMGSVTHKVLHLAGYQWSRMAGLLGSSPSATCFDGSTPWRRSEERSQLAAASTPEFWVASKVSPGTSSLSISRS